MDSLIYGNNNLLLVSIGLLIIFFRYLALWNHIKTGVINDKLVITLTRWTKKEGWLSR